MLPGEELFAFLHDVFALSSPAQTRSLHDLFGEELARAGIRLHTSKIVMLEPQQHVSPALARTRARGMES